ncbi:hypothetical protein TpMuguga_03g00006 [Theileria parva strain Muguga]|uniref:uncharacterized protein n=1 Tax=Theileria parva strain Muguga TaxID=333668 RepID=UPI001C624329|nr:uncharacterized protein TpMuguga_03g00006 [Theileria parva strain Muguga]EAN30742.2 hypothetical protein TpMuguga_03g00006 [Theileria parva strain Muguga]
MSTQKIVKSRKSVETSITTSNNTKLKIKNKKGSKLIKLNIDSQKSTDGYHCIPKNAAFEYISRSGYIFNKVLKGKKVIWESQNNEFGYKVMIKSYNNEDYMTIFFTNKKFKVFKAGKNDIFEMITDIKTHSDLKTFDDEISSNTDVDSCIKLYTKDNEGKNVLMPTDMYDVEFNGEDVEVYSFKKGSKCTMVKLGNCVIWEYEKNKNI